MEPCTTTTTIVRSDQTLYEIKSNLLHPTSVALAVALHLTAAVVIKLDQATIFYPSSCLLSIEDEAVTVSLAD